MSDCVRANRLFGSCNFEARYDTVPTVDGQEAFWLGPDKLEALSKRTYVRDVCTRCGRTIERLGCSDRSERKGETK